MSCRKCGREVIQQAKFCGYCGERAAVACSSCNVLNPPGGLFCYALGLHHASGYRRPMLVLASLGLAAVAHAVFNILAFAPLPLPLGAVVLTIGGAIWVFSRFKWGQRISPFRYRRNYPEVACPSCGRLIRIMSRFCRFCGAPAASEAGRLFCGHCGAGNRPDAGYCTSCGDRLLLT